MTIQYSIAIATATAATTDLVIWDRCDGHEFRHDGDKPYYFEATAYLPTEEEAQRWAALFPKGIGLKARPVVCYDSANADGIRKGLLRLQINLSPDKVNGGINETGIRRIKALARTCAKLGITLEQDKRWGNSAQRSIEQYGWSK